MIRTGPVVDYHRPGMEYLDLLLQGRISGGGYIGGIIDPLIDAFAVLTFRPIDAGKEAAAPAVFFDQL